MTFVPGTIAISYIRIKVKVKIYVSPYSTENFKLINAEFKPYV